MPLPREFYARPTLEVAADLLGKVLVRVTHETRTAGLIVEAEAYVGEDDPACHAASGLTPRNAPLYGPPGTAYVYLNYGVHCLLNAVTEREGHPAAVLIRALEPLEGIDRMRERRSAGRHAPATLPDAALCRGPGNLSRALGITLADNRADLTSTTLFIEDRGLRIDEIAWTPRIGIRLGADRLWRVAVAGHAAVSKVPRPKAAAPAEPPTQARRGRRQST